VTTETNYTPGQGPAPKKGRGLLYASLTIAALVASSAAITQYAAHRLNYHPALGRPLIGHAYAPWMWFEWQWTYYRTARATWAICYTAFFLTFMVIMLAFVFTRGSKRSAKKQEGIYGTAHWATKKEIEATTLIPREGEKGAGVYVGGWTAPDGTFHYLRHDGPEHVAGIAPTRSGKGVGLVVPTLLSWPASCVVNDPKLELWSMTAGWRSKHANNRCLLFNPGSEHPDAVSYNPLEEIRLGTAKEVGDTQNIVTMIVDPDGKGLGDHWTKTAHAFLTGVVMHMKYKNRHALATFYCQTIARRAAMAGQSFAASYEAADSRKGRRLTDAEEKELGDGIVDAAIRVFYAARDGGSWDVLGDREQAAVKLYLSASDDQFIGEYMQWVDNGSRWKQCNDRERANLVGFAAKSDDEQRAELVERNRVRVPVALPDITRALADPRRPINDLYAEMLENRHDVFGMYAGGEDELKHPGQHPIVASSAAAMLNRPEEERGSVLSTANSYLSLYDDPVVAKNVRRSDFKISDLMNSDTPVTLYLACREEDKDRMKPLIRLMLNQILRVLLRPQLQYVEGRQLPPHKHRLLLLIDEFPSLGKLEIMEDALSYIAGYGIKAYLIMQDVAQLWSNKAYGRDESILSNCHIRVAYAPNKIETAEWLSKQTGKMTVNMEKYTESGNRYGAILGSTSRSWEATGRELLTPDEAMRLRAPQKDGQGRITEAGDLLVFVAGHAPIQGQQSLYFRDPRFLERMKIAPPETSDSHNLIAHAPKSGVRHPPAKLVPGPVFGTDGKGGVQSVADAWKSADAGVVSADVDSHAVTRPMAVFKLEEGDNL
jgi:type IV secretory pathway TraG/TraD family ATPase VirD4